MAILDVLITLFVIGVLFAIGVIMVAFLELRHRLRKSMRAANSVPEDK